MASKQQAKDEERSGAGAANGKKASSILEAIQRLRQEEERERAKSGPVVGQSAAVAASDDIRTQSYAQPIPAVVAPPHRSKARWFGPDHHAMAMYSRQLATLVDVGIPLLEALRILSRRGS